MDRPIHYGSWCQRESYLTFQDVLTGTRSARATEEAPPAGSARAAVRLWPNGHRPHFSCGSTAPSRRSYLRRPPSYRAPAQPDADRCSLSRRIEQRPRRKPPRGQIPYKSPIRIISTRCGPHSLSRRIEQRPRWKPPRGQIPDSSPIRIITKTGSMRCGPCRLSRRMSIRVSGGGLSSASWNWKPS